MWTFVLATSLVLAVSCFVAAILMQPRHIGRAVSDS